MSFKLIVSGNYFQFKSKYSTKTTAPNYAKITKSKEHTRMLKDTYGIENIRGQKRSDNLSRVRNNFKLLAHANSNQYSKLITLTTQTPLTSGHLRQCLHGWLKQLKRDTKENKLKYIGVYEYQDRGALHIHLIFFNSVFINWEKSLKHWRSLIGGLGSVQIKKLQAIKHINYLCAYLNEDAILDLGHKSMIRSLYLEKPEVYQDTIPNHLKNHYLKVEYSRILGHSASNDCYENIYGYLTKDVQEFDFEHAKDFLRISNTRLDTFRSNRDNNKRGYIPQNEETME